MRLRDETAAWREGYCRACNLMFGSASVVLFDSATPRGSNAGAVRPRLGRPGWILAGGAIGGFIGSAAGILGSLAMYPSSNIAPAYGLLLIGP